MNWLPNFRYLVLAFLLSSLCGCHLIFHPDVEQGNLITTYQAAAIHPGMTKEQVVAILGYPVLVNIYKDNRMLYVYTLVPGHGQVVKKQLLITIYNNQVVGSTSNIPRY